MNPPFSHHELYKELEVSLLKSNGAQRKIWVTTIVENKVDIQELSNLLKGDRKIATRFLWLLSEIGLFNPNTLFAELPFLWEVCRALNPVYKTSFASFWLIAGLPPQNESEAIDVLFHWVLSPAINVTIKSRAIMVLLKLTQKYPELKNELKLCIEDQQDKYSKDFAKRVTKILKVLER